MEAGAIGVVKVRLKIGRLDDVGVHCTAFLSFVYTFLHRTSKLRPFAFEELRIKMRIARKIFSLQTYWLQPNYV